MIVRAKDHKGLGSTPGSDCFCSSTIGVLITGGGTACWTAFPCTDSSSDYGGASNPNTPMPQQWINNESMLASEIATGTDPNAPSPNCVSTIITSPIAVCDWIIYLGGVILVAPLAISLLESRR